LRRLSNDKCWYCESKDLRSDNAVDHYRPKGNVKDSAPPHDGYWWLAFDWRNYRFSCTFCNSIRNSPTTSGGKQDYFPLHDEAKRARLAADDLADELPMLIDPVLDGDPALISFEADGTARPMAMDEETIDYQRADISIKRYHLNHPDAAEARLALFVQLKKWLKEADSALDRAAKGKGDGRVTAHERMRDLRASIKVSAEYSAAARSFLQGMEQDSKAARSVLR
jgi:uncharacterized protein (TIGR02646 family)